MTRAGGGKEHIADGLVWCCILTLELLGFLGVTGSDPMWVTANLGLTVT